MIEKIRQVAVAIHRSIGEESTGPGADPPPVFLDAPFHRTDHLHPTGIERRQPDATGI